MKVIADLCLIPIGTGPSLGSYIAECEKILIKAGLKIKLHAYGTNIEGDWDQVMQAVRRCHETLHQIGIQRISSTIRVATRSDREETLEDRVRSVEEKLQMKEGNR